MKLNEKHELITTALIAALAYVVIRTVFVGW